jgi:peptidoglycan/LPS O-acetylase OafA/YrhL
MSPLNPLFAGVALAAALATVWLVNWRTPAAAQDRFISIDGLRGYLAFFVFLHHSAIWYFYLRTGRWEAPSSRLFGHFGQVSVALFFMITSFLFFSKLLGARSKPIDWTRLYVSRVLRLTPLYLFAMALLAVVVAQLSHFALQEPPAQLLLGAARWLTFTVVGGPPLNGIAETSTIIAMVTWSLSYEWLFYLSLPLLALFVRIAPPRSYLVLSVASVVGFSFLRPAAPYLLAFLGGIAAAVAVRVPQITKLLRGPVGALVAVGSLAIVCCLFPITDRIEAGALPFLALAFVIVAAGNDLLGLLRAPVSRQLGEMAYSIYLLHGFVLFLVFKYLIGFERAASLPPVGHWAVVVGCAPVLVLISHASYRLIELPPNQSVPAVSTWLESRFRRRRLAKPSDPATAP